MKKCKFCAEDIQDDAKKCRYCGEWINKESWKFLNVFVKIILALIIWFFSAMLIKMIAVDSYAQDGKMFIVDLIILPISFWLFFRKNIVIIPIFPFIYFSKNEKNRTNNIKNDTSIKHDDNIKYMY